MTRDAVRRALRHPVAQNVMALGTVQVAITVVPLITLPYLARVLDRSEFGRVVFVQTFSFLVALVVEYGFNLSATRDVARRRADPAALSRTVAGVQGAKAMLSLLAAALSLVLLPVVPIFRDAPELLAYGVALGILQGFVPVWFFLGVERARPVALAELTSRMAALALVVALVHGESEGELVLAVYVVAAAASTGGLTLLMWRRARPEMPTRAGSLEALRRGRTLFAGTGATAFYTGANAFLLGLVIPAAQVAVFASAEKIVRAGNRVLGLMAQAVYPRVSVLVARGSLARARRLSVLSLLSFGGAALTAAGALAVFAPDIVRLVFGSDFRDAAPLLRILAVALPLNVIGVVLSSQWLLPHGRDRRVTGVLVLASLLNAAVVVAAAELSGLHAAAWAIVLVELFVLCGNALGLRAIRSA
jgi:PST family polysaccharide transporter